MGNTTHAADRVWDATGRADGQADGDGAQPRRRGVSPYLGRTDILLRWSSPLTALPLPRRAAQVSFWTRAATHETYARRWRNATRRASQAWRAGRTDQGGRRGKGAEEGQARQGGWPWATEGVGGGDVGARRRVRGVTAAAGHAARRQMEMADGELAGGEAGRSLNLNG